MLFIQQFYITEVILAYPDKDTDSLMAFKKKLYKEATPGCATELFGPFFGQNCLMIFSLTECPVLIVYLLVMQCGVALVVMA